MNEEELEELRRLFDARIIRITAKLLRGGIISDDDDSASVEDVEAWFDEMVDAIADFHRAAATLITSSDDIIRSLTGIVADQVGYLDSFADDLKEMAENGQLGKIVSAPIENYKTPAQIMAQARMYSGAIRASAFTALTRGLPLPAMPCEGTLCHTNCKCSWSVTDIDAEAGDHDAFWIRGAKDSCQTCIIRAQEWSPVRIRGGILQL